ncbi:cardiotrophin-2-like [Bufo gargarizans]|uniref:cardiotrophin-2-like n=1 Tax=Bufo gargarizans TaxID=30331 RepID=UPI001CF3EF2D|nr:cardiotrophin-2-like [Bufo gargarizans]
MTGTCLRRGLHPQTVSSWGPPVWGPCMENVQQVAAGGGGEALTSQGRTSREFVCGPEEEETGIKEGSAAPASTLVESAAGMEVITEHLAGIPSQDQDGKEAKRQAQLLVSMAKSQAGQLVDRYLSHQGPPFSDNGAKVPQAKVEDLPTLDQNNLPSSPWKRLNLSLRAFLSLREWLAAVHLWQRSLNPKAWELLDLLEIAESNSRAISSNLTALLGRQDVSSPSLTALSTTMKKKVAGYMVCKSFYEWLNQTERDLMILLAESPV